MGLFKKLAGLGVAAGAVVAGMKIADKYKENNPEGVQPKEGAAKVRPEDVLNEVAKAATEVYNDAAVAVKTTAAQVADSAPEYLEKVKNTAKDVVESIKPPVKGEPVIELDLADVKEEIEDELEEAAEEIKEKAEAVKDIIGGE